MGQGYMYGPGYQYQQPGYAPPGSYAPPGTLVVPPSNAPLYDPANGGGSTYESNPGATDTWSPGGGNSGSGGMFDEGGLVPAPKDPNPNGANSPFYEEDNFKNNSGVQFNPEKPDDRSGGLVAPDQRFPSDALLVARPVSYGFDTGGYRWLQGVLRKDQATGKWGVTYNLSGDDTFRGDMVLTIPDEKLAGLDSGAVVQVRGKVDSENLDSRGRATYRVDHIYEVPVSIQ